MGKENSSILRLQTKVCPPDKVCFGPPVPALLRRQLCYSSGGKDSGAPSFGGKSSFQSSSFPADPKALVANRITEIIPGLVLF